MAIAVYKFDWILSTLLKDFHRKLTFKWSLKKMLQGFRFVLKSLIFYFIFIFILFILFQGVLNLPKMKMNPWGLKSS